MRPKFIALFLLTAVLAGLAVWRSSGIRTMSEPEDPDPAATAPPAPVAIAHVRRQRVDEDLTAVGSLLADEALVIRPEIAGRIEAIRFAEGARVAAGEVLFELNRAENHALLAQSEAQQQLDRQNFERVSEMRAKNLASAQQYDEVLAKLKFSNANVEKERVRLEKMVIRAPFAGLVGLRQVAIGDYVTEGQDLVNLEALNPVKVDFKLPEKYSASLKPGLLIAASVEAFPGRSFEGVVYAIDPRLDDATRTVKVRARLPNDNLSLRPGMFAKIRLGLKGMRDALFIPEQALLMKGSGAFAYRFSDGRAYLTAVTTGLRLKGSVEIAAGLAEGEAVVTDGQTRLRDGAPVEVIDPETPQPR